MEYSTGGSLPKITVYTPKYIDSTGKTIDTFSDWKPITIVTATNVVSAMHHYSSTIKQYGVTNGYSYSVSYIVGNSDYTGVSPFKAGSYKLALKIK